MRKSFYSFIIILFVSLTILVFSSVDKKIPYEQEVISTFNQTNVQALMSNMSFKGLLCNCSMQTEDLKDIVKTVVNHLNIDMSTIQEENNSSDSYNEYSIFSRTTDDEKIKITAWSERSDKENEIKSYITLEVIQDDVNNDLNKTKIRIQQILMPYVTSLEVNNSITGTYRGRMDEGLIETLNRGIFGDVYKIGPSDQAQDDYVSVFEPSGSYNNPVTLEQRDNKAQLDIRYTEHEDKTYITFRAPKIIK